MMEVWNKKFMGGMVLRLKKRVCWGEGRGATGSMVAADV